MVRSMLKRWMGVGVIGFLLISPARATEYYVDCLDGDDVNDGLTAGTAKKTIQAAVDLASTVGDIVSILPGECLQGFTMGAAQSGTTLRGLGEVVVIAAEESVVQATNDIRIETITFRGAGLTALNISAGTNIRVERCRFFERPIGIKISPASTDIEIRECLFADNTGGTSGALYFSGGTTGVVVERCTFARNALGISGATAYAVIRNCAFFENDSSFNGGVVTYNNFFGEPASCPDPIGTNNCDDPLFIDPDNRVYHVRAGSPVLNQGQDGGPIGAFGQGFHTSKDMSKDEPAQETPPDAAPWRDWIDQNGDAIASSTLVELNDLDEILLKEGVTSAAVYSPVFDTGSAFTVIHSVDFAAFEDISLPADSRKIIDAVQGTPQREIRIRTQTDAEGPFVQDPTITPPDWQDEDKQVKFEKRARYVQMELVLRIDGN